MRRNAFTLVELMIVIAIVSILAAMAMAALAGAVEEGKRTRARAQIVKLDQLISEKWNSYKFRQLPVRPPATLTSATDIARFRLYALRELMRMEMPDRLTDIKDDPVILRNSANQPIIPSVTQAYLRAVAQAPQAQTTLSYDQAEMLYLIVSQMRDGDRSALNFLLSSEIGDLDGDGLNEILDPWGQPIMFLRWAPGHSKTTTADLGMGAPAPTIATVVSTMQYPDGSAAPDGFDLLRSDPRFTDPSFGFKPFLLRPLIVSGGPDKTIDLYNDFGDNSGGAGHYRQTNPPNDPYTFGAIDRIWIGTPYDADGNGSLDNGDNITNHGLEIEGGGR